MHGSTAGRCFHEAWTAAEAAAVRNRQQHVAVSSHQLGFGVCVLAWISVPRPSGQEGAVLHASHLGDCVQRGGSQLTSDILLRQREAGRLQMPVMAPLLPV